MLKIYELKEIKFDYLINALRPKKIILLESFLIFIGKPLFTKAGVYGAIKYQNCF